MRTARIVPKFIIASLLVCVSVVPLAAQDLAKQKQALDVINEFALSLCDSVQANGKSEAWEVSGDAKARLNGVVKKVADLGITSAVKYTSSEYQGVLQSDLGKVLDNQTNCRLAVFKDLKEKLLPGSAPSKPSATSTDNPDILSLLSRDIVLFRDVRFGMNRNAFSSAMTKNGLKLKKGLGDLDPDTPLYTADDGTGALSYDVFATFRNNHLVEIIWTETVAYEKPSENSNATVEQIAKDAEPGKAASYACEEQANLPLKLELSLGKPYREYKGYDEKKSGIAGFEFFDAEHHALYTKNGASYVLMSRELQKHERIDSSPFSKTEDNIFSPHISVLSDYSSASVRCEINIQAAMDNYGVDEYVQATTHLQNYKQFETSK
jgi:hypothetical protein